MKVGFALFRKLEYSHVFDLFILGLLAGLSDNLRERLLQESRSVIWSGAYFWIYCQRHKGIRSSTVGFVAKPGSTLMTAIRTRPSFAGEGVDLDSWRVFS